jgi:hypothetical protein
MGIHVTPIPRLTVLTVPAFTLGTANAAGSADTAIASNSTLLAFDTTLPAAVGTAAVGAATVAPRRDHVHAPGTAPAFARVIRTAGDVTTTSTSLVDLTGATLTFTTGAFPVQYAVAQSASISATGTSMQCNVDLDGTLLHGSQGLQAGGGVGGQYFDWSFSGQTAALSAGEHVIKVQWMVGDDTGTMRASTYINHMWSVMEIR